MKWFAYLWSTMFVIGQGAFAETNFQLNLSESCGAYEASLNPSPHHGPSTESIRIGLEDFYVQTLKPETVERSCSADIYVTIPKNKQFRILALAAHGQRYLTPGTIGQVGVDYVWSQAQEPQETLESLQDHGRFRVAVEDPGAGFSACHGEDREVFIQAKAKLSLTQNNHGISSMELAKGAEDLPGVVLTWQWRSCPSTVFDRPFEGYFEVGSSIRYRTVIYLNGHEGSYLSSSGFTGRLTDILYTEDLEVRGKWHSPTRSGWFYWKVVDQATGAFEGNWGNFGTGALGHWHGRWLQDSEE